MAKLTIVVGMAGSGKTRYCKDLAVKNGALAYSDFTLINPADNTQRAGHNKLPELVAKLLQGRDCVADEAHLCDPSFRKEFERFVKNNLPDTVEVEWIFFAKDPVACAENVVADWKNENGRQEEGRVASLLNQIDRYMIPEGAKTVPCHSSAPGTLKDTDAAVAALRGLKKS